MGGGPEILKRGGVLYFRWCYISDFKGQNNVRNYKFLAKCFCQCFQIFSVFINNESLPMKSYQFFRIYKSFDKEREKTLMQRSMRKEKLREVGICFITGCFLKPFKMIINHFFYFASSFAVQFLLFDFRITQEISSKGEIGDSQ